MAMLDNKMVIVSHHGWVPSFGYLKNILNHLTHTWIYRVGWEMDHYSMSD